MTEQEKTRLVDEYTDLMELRKGNAVDFGGWLMEQVEEGREREAKLRAEVDRLRRRPHVPFPFNRRKLDQ